MANVADPVDRRVRTVSVLLGVAALTCLIDAIIAASRLIGIDGVADAVRSAARAEGWDGAELVATVRAATWFNALVAIGGLLLLAWLGRATRRRSPRSRGAVYFAAAALSAVLLFGAATDRGNATPDATQPAGLRAALEQLTPAWYPPVHSLLAGLVVIGIVVAAIAVARISSIDFYR
jgi:hypothetical protein